MKSIDQQIKAMRRRWPSFEVSQWDPNHVMWFGSLAPIEKSYRIMVDYELPHDSKRDEQWCWFPLVQVLSPRLTLCNNAAEEAPLPHVYFDERDPTMSPLCLFDPLANEWSHNDLIALTTIPWAADWLACYEGWLATGKWLGGGRHIVRTPQNEEMP